MKTTIVLSLLLAGPIFAGTSQVMSEPSPAPVSQDSWSWFVGGTGGYLFDFDEDIYTFQFGANSPWSVGGWSVALFAEAGWTENHHDIQGTVPFGASNDGDIEIVPMTFNVKLEKLISGSLSAYLGGGLGASYLDAQYNSPFPSDDSDDWVFTAQVFGGLAYRVNETVEVFGGGRWIYFDDPDFKGLSLGDDWMVEGGVRFHF